MEWKIQFETSPFPTPDYPGQIILIREKDIPTPNHENNTELVISVENRQNSEKHHHDKYLWADMDSEGGVYPSSAIAPGTPWAWVRK